MRAFVFRTRGLYLTLSLSVILVLKHVSSSRVDAAVFLVCAGLSVPVMLVRVWAAGFVGGRARAGSAHATSLLTAGPYAYVRNPMYLTALVLGVLYSLASGLWYSVPIWLAAYAFVHGQVIPFEEEFLRRKFGSEYEEYARRVPRLGPLSVPYAGGHGVFSVREALLNEVPALVFVPVFWLLYWQL